VLALPVVGEHTYLTERLFACKIGEAGARWHWVAQWAAWSSRKWSLKVDDRFA
jgi:hypothetical protein